MLFVASNGLEYTKRKDSKVEAAQKWTNYPPTGTQSAQKETQETPAIFLCKWC
jgi:hypothetical protein